MKRLRITTRFLAVTLFGAMTFTAGQAGAGSITDPESPHNLGTQICVFCHTPHNSDTSVVEAPLWNHALTTVTFTMYDSPTFDATQDTQPTGSSKLCLSCHDGVTAIDAYGTNPGGVFMSGLSAIGQGADLTDDHPISINYDSALATLDPGLHDPTTVNVEIGTGAADGKTRNGLVSDLLLPGGKVQCSSCHDVHNNFVAAGSTSGKLLKVTDAGSAICLTCHAK